MFEEIVIGTLDFVSKKKEGVISACVFQIGCMLVSIYIGICKRKFGAYFREMVRVQYIKL